MKNFKISAKQHYVISLAREFISDYANKRGYDISFTEFEAEFSGKYYLSAKLSIHNDRKSYTEVFDDIEKILHYYLKNEVFSMIEEGVIY